MESINNICMITKDQFTKKFAEKLRMIREEKKMTQEDLAHDAQLYPC
jgi:DNA-binding XRE family transcriptional regulator